MHAAESSWRREISSLLSERLDRLIDGCESRGTVLLYVIMKFNTESVYFRVHLARCYIKATIMNLHDKYNINCITNE